MPANASICWAIFASPQQLQFFVVIKLAYCNSQGTDNEYDWYLKDSAQQCGKANLLRVLSLTVAMKTIHVSGKKNNLICDLLEWAGHNSLFQTFN